MRCLGHQDSIVLSCSDSIRTRAPLGLRTLFECVISAVLATLIILAINTFKIFHVCQIIYNYLEALSSHYISMCYTCDLFRTVVVGEEHVFSFREEILSDDSVLHL
jgi:hypothetical protein